MSRRFPFALLLLSLAGQAGAAPVFYNSRANFQAAAGTLTAQSFENILVSLPQATLTFPGFTVSETNGVNAITSTAVNSVFGTIPVTDGNVAIWFDDNGDSIGTFEFGSPIRAFGVDVTVNVSGLMTIGGDLSTSFALVANTPAFFGVIDTDSFDTITFSAAAGPEVGFDYVQYGTGGGGQQPEIPEPSSFVLMSLGAAAVWALRARTR